MAGRWVKSLQCKSRAFDDVHSPTPKHLLPAAASCRSTAQNIRDVVVVGAGKDRPKKPKLPPPSKAQPPAVKYSRSSTTKAEPVPSPVVRTRRSASARPARGPDPFYPSLTELPVGHPSRNVVEIIFHTSWSPKDFAGRIEMILKVQNGPKTVARFDEYREAVKARAGSGRGADWEENARCVADGNEVMRFQCLGATSAGGWTLDACGGAWAIQGGKGVCTFSGSGEAHESAGGGRGRRAMLVCRVIAGRVSRQMGMDGLIDGRVGFDSVSGDKGELLVLDTRAVLPCFLIIYKLQKN